MTVHPIGPLMRKQIRQLSLVQNGLNQPLVNQGP